MIIPVQGRILAWLTAAVTLFSFGVWYHAPLFGVFSILHLGVAVLFATNRLPFFLYRRQQVVDRQAQKKQEMMSKAYYDDVNRRSKEREERERLRRMFEDSMDE
jgi:hypothetical protein